MRKVFKSEGGISAAEWIYWTTEFPILIRIIGLVKKAIRWDLGSNRERKFRILKPVVRVLTREVADSVPAHQKTGQLNQYAREVIFLGHESGKAFQPLTLREGEPILGGILRKHWLSISSINKLIMVRITHEEDVFVLAIIIYKIKVEKPESDDRLWLDGLARWRDQNMDQARAEIRKELAE